MTDIHVMNSELQPEDVNRFWFEELTPAQQFKKSNKLDADIKTRFLPTWRRILAGETEEWRASAHGRLAEIIVLDQFSRNMFRGLASAFLADSVALILAQEAVRTNADKELDERQRTFLYMPYMHSESVKIHKQAMILFGDLPNLDYEIKHKAIIDRFGRYPHRNEILGRESSAEEIEWMKSNPGF